MFVDNRKRKRQLAIKKYSYPEFTKEVIPEYIKEEIDKRNNESIDFKSEFKVTKNDEEEILYEINQFEIFYSDNNLKKVSKKSSPNRYDYIHKIEQKRNFYIQGVVTKPLNSKYLNQLIVAKISEYSLQYGEKYQWSLWIKVADKDWFKLCDPYKFYEKYFNPTLYRFKVVMHTTQLFEKDKKNLNYSNLEKNLKKNIKEYYSDDILYFKDEVFKHVKEFLSLSSNDETMIALDKEMKNKIYELQHNPVTKKIISIENKPLPPHNSLDKIQNDVNKEVKRIGGDMKLYFDRRLDNKENYKDLDKEEFETTPKDLDLDSIKCMVSNLGGDKKRFKEYYLGNREIEGVKTGYPYNYDYDFNNDENDQHIGTNTVIDKSLSKDIPIEEREKYLNKRDVLEFSKLPKETITYKRYESLYLENSSIQQHNFNLDDDPNQDLLPFLVCRVCGIGKHIIGANIDPQQKIDNEMSQSIQDYICHLEKHRLELTKSLSKKERDIIDKSMVFNSYLNRSKIENIEANAMLQLENDSNSTNIQTRSKSQGTTTSTLTFNWS